MRKLFANEIKKNFEQKKVIKRTQQDPHSTHGSTFI